MRAQREIIGGTDADVSGGSGTQCKAIFAEGMEID
jgi:hypothetical protein